MKKLIVWIMALSLCVFFSVQPLQATSVSNLVLSKNSEKTKKVALTFDDGPHPRYTPEILSILAEYGITATFFVIGINALHYPEALDAIVASGCEIGNHTYSHNNLRYASREQVEQEITDCQNEIMSRTGRIPTLFRPPEGRFNCYLEDVAASEGFHIILWSIDTLDWAHTPPKEIVQRVLSQLDHGDIILMHDYTSGKNTTCDALRILIPALLDRGYEFVSVSQLISGDAS